MQDADTFAALADALRASGRAAEADEAQMAAIALAERSALMFYNLGTFYLMTKRPALAVRWLRAALDVDPALVAAHQNLSAALELEGSTAAAQHHRDEAYRRQCLFVDGAPTAVRGVLVLCTAGTGTVPLDFLLPQARNRRLKWIMEYASLDQVAQLPQYDVVFNAIGDPDVTAASRDTVRRFLETCRKPVVNPPVAVARTSRDRIPELLKDIDDVLVPATVRLPAHAEVRARFEQLEIAGVHPPLLLRPVGSHGGRGLELIETPAALAAAGAGADSYASVYHDYRSADGYYRKYRVVFVDRQPYPYHLAISADWLVHYVSADMLPHRWKRDEELRFLADPGSVLGERGMNALAAIGQRLDLDYCGVDFSIAGDGRILVFEANATMLVHTEDFHDALKFKNPYVRRILDAFDALLEHRGD